ncbi:MAG: hypothetical protein JNN28_00570 [Saprospiraceae bacterium]|nr:hypothetical protein [Saprospiraceae bacterium]
MAHSVVFRLLVFSLFAGLYSCNYSVSVSTPNQDNQMLGPGDKLTIEFHKNALIDPKRTHIIQYFYQKDAQGNLVKAGKPDTLSHSRFSDKPLEAGKQYSTSFYGKFGFEPYTSFKVESPFTNKPNQFAQESMSRLNIKLATLTFAESPWIWDEEYKSYSAAIVFDKPTPTKLLLTFDQPATDNNAEITIVPMDSLWQRRPNLPPDDSLFIINGQLMINTPLHVKIPKGSKTVELNVQYNPDYGYSHGKLEDYMAFKIDVSGISTRPPVVFICSTDK